MQRLRSFVTGAVLAVSALIAGLFAADDPQVAAAPNFNAATLVALTSTATNADADQNTTFTIPAPDYNFSSVVTAGPGSGLLAPSPGHSSYVPGTHPALGDVVGNLSSNTFLGLANGPCNTNLTVTFTFMVATVDNSPGNLIDPVPQGGADNNPATTGDNPQGGTQANQWTDDGSWTDTSLTVHDAGTTPLNGLPAQVERYPSYLNTIFTPDGGSPVQPIARYAGATNVANTIVTLNFVIFAPGALANAFSPPHPFADLGEVGYTSIAILQNPAAPAAPGAITDFCTPLNVTTTVFGETKVNPCNGITTPPCNTAALINAPAPGGNTGRDRARNPSTPGTYLYVAFHQSLRDSDGDGKENAFDPCALTSDTFDHRTGTGADADSDGIPDACDSAGGGGTDQDGDGWQNRGDNCPQASNPTNVETETTTAYVTAAPRGGPRTDGIGDACDPNTSRAEGVFQTTVSVSPKCIGGTDVDGDGWCNAASGGLPADPNDASASITPEAYARFFPFPLVHAGSGTPLTREPVQVCNDGTDNDGDGKVDLLDNGKGTAARTSRTAPRSAFRARSPSPPAHPWAAPPTGTATATATRPKSTSAPTRWAAAASARSRTQVSSGPPTSSRAAPRTAPTG